jgi:hypothetical protein
LEKEGEINLPKEGIKGFVYSPCDCKLLGQADHLLFLVRGHGLKDYAEV